MYKLFLFTLCFIYISSVKAEEPKIYSITYKGGKTFQHFSFTFTSENIRLPKDFPNRRKLDDTSENFKYGQFEVFIPSEHLKLPQSCKTNYIVRMPQTLNLNRSDEIKEKQDLFKELSDVSSGKKKEVTVVIEIYYKKGCNLFFRTSKSKYIDYVGLLH